MPETKRDQNKTNPLDRTADALEALAQAANGEPIESTSKHKSASQTMQGVTPDPSALHGTGGATGASSVQQRRAVQARAARDRADQLKRMLIPPMLVVAMLLFAIGGWAVAALCGHDLLTDVPSPATDRLAKIMLLCWPVGVLTVLGVWAFQRNVKHRARRD